VYLDVIYQLLLNYSGVFRYWRKGGSIMGQHISYFQISKTRMTRKRSIVQNSIRMKLVRPTKMHFNETYRKVPISKTIR